MKDKELAVVEEDSLKREKGEYCGFKPPALEKRGYCVQTGYFAWDGRKILFVGANKL